ncbi:MAG: hypothetical protein R3B45_06070 [Bdellovibrionota bacterium]
MNKYVIIFFILFTHFKTTAYAIESENSNTKDSLEKEKNYSFQSPFEQCKIYPRGKTAQENQKEEKKALYSLKAEFKKDYPLADSALNKIFDQVINTPPNKEDYQTSLEKLSNLLNKLDRPKIKLSSKAAVFIKTQNKFNSSKKRAPSALGKNDRCIKDNSKQFDEFSIGLRKSLKLYFSNHDFAKKLLTLMQNIRFFPSGSRVFFGATTARTKQKPHICINPEEETTLLLPKMLHELTHAQNKEIAILSEDFDQKKGLWRDTNKAFRKIDDQLRNFDKELSPDSEIEAENMSELVEELTENQLSNIVQLLKETASTNIPYSRIPTEKGFIQHAKLLQKWKETFEKEIETRKEAVKVRKQLDIMRYYDEHLAYAISLKAAYTLVKEDPDFFCQIWVPSYQKKRPVLFYQAYQDLEEKIHSQTFSHWLADLYTFETNNFLKESLYGEHSRKAGPIKTFLDQGKLIMDQQFNN